MKENIHPEYTQTRVTCACGASYDTASTKPNFPVAECAACHPFYTGKQKEVAAKGQVDKFNRRYATKGKAPAAGGGAEGLSPPLALGVFARYARAGTFPR